MFLVLIFAFMETDFSKADFVAGVVDSGSYISIVKTQRSLVPVVRIRRKKADMINEVHSFYPGYRGISGKGDKTLYWLNYQGKKAIEFLWLIYPRLKDKRQHAEIIFSFGRLKKKYQKEHGAHAKLTEIEAAMRQSHLMSIQALNKQTSNADAETESIFD